MDLFIQESNLDDLIEEGVMAFDIGEYAEAYHIFTVALAVNPENRELKTKLRCNRAMAAWKLGDMSDALYDYMEILKYDEKNPEALLHRALLRISLQHYVQALRDYSKVEVKTLSAETEKLMDEVSETIGNVISTNDIFSKCRNIWCWAKTNVVVRKIIEAKEIEGEQAIQEGRFTHAYSIYKNIIFFNTTYGTKRAELLCNLAKTAFKLGRIDEAVVNYTSALAYDSKCGCALEQRGTIYMDRGYYSKALDDFRSAVNVNPSLANLHQLVRAERYILAYCLLEDSESKFTKCSYEEAYGKCQNALLMLEKDSSVRKEMLARFHFNLARIAKKLGRVYEANAELETAARLNKAYLKELASRTRLSIQLGDFNQAINDLEKLVLSDPGKNKENVKLLAYAKSKVSQRFNRNKTEQDCF